MSASFGHFLIDLLRVGWQTFFIPFFETFPDPSEKTMTEPKFVDGRDTTTFAPFILIDCRDSQWKDVRLEFSDWDWCEEHIGGEYLGEVYLNGYGIQGLVFAARIAAGLDPIPAGVEPDSEGDTCFLHFSSLETAVETATLAHAMIHDPAKRSACAELAVEEGLDDI